LLRARGLVCFVPLAGPRRPLPACCRRVRRRCRVLQETPETEEIIERVAALDIGKAELMCCVRVPDDDRPGRRLQEVRAYGR
jgi:hypothetical protein